MKKSFLIVVLILLCACKQREDNKPLPVNNTDTIVTEKEAIETKHLNEQTGDTIHMLAQDEKGNYSAIGEIDSLHSRIYIKFNNQSAANLKASIKTMEGEGNIRFNQIIFPDKTADGPFAKEMELQLKQTGEHTLIIGHSLMAEGQYEGKFKVELIFKEAKIPN